jgi:hypothetical protein
MMGRSTIFFGRWSINTGDYSPSGDLVKKSMKHFLLARRRGSFLIMATLGLFGLAFSACSGTSANNNASSSSSTAAHGDWSAKINGQLLSASNAASPDLVSLHQDNTVDGTHFTLGYNQNQPGFEMLILKDGTTHATERDNTTVINFRNSDSTLYIAQDVTVNYDQGKKKGTFSGTFKNAHYGRPKSPAPETLSVTEGVFELP